MNRIQPFLFLFTTIIAITVSFSDVLAQESMFTSDTLDEVDAEIVARVAIEDAEFAMTTNEGSVDLMVINESILIQFSNRFMDEFDKEMKEEVESDSADSHLATVFKSMVTSGVKTLLDRAITIPLSDISEIYYENGKLYIISREGEELFKNLDMNDKKVMEDFSPRDARRFVAETEKRML